MQSQLAMTRAVSGEFLKRKFVPFVIVFAVTSLLALGVSFWLTTVNVWWWILAAPVFVAVLVGAVLCVLANIAVTMVRPTLTKEQKLATIGFVEKLERVAENLQMPMFMILFRIVFDILRHNEKTFIHTVAADSISLRHDLIKLNKHFR